MFEKLIEPWREGRVLSPVQTRFSHGFVVPCLNWKSPAGLAKIFCEMHRDQFTIRGEFDVGVNIAEEVFLSRIQILAEAINEYKCHARCTPHLWLLLSPSESWQDPTGIPLQDDLTLMRRIYNALMDQVIETSIALVTGPPLVVESLNTMKALRSINLSINGSEEGRRQEAFAALAHVQTLAAQS